MSRADHKSDLCEINVFVRLTTERAALVDPGFKTRKPAWVPLSQVELSPNEDGRTHLLIIPEWLAIEKGLV